MPSLVVSSGSFHSRLTRVVPTFEVLRPQGVPGSVRNDNDFITKENIRFLKRKRSKSTLLYDYITI